MLSDLAVFLRLCHIPCEPSPGGRITNERRSTVFAPDGGLTRRNIHVRSTSRSSCQDCVCVGWSQTVLGAGKWTHNDLSALNFPKPHLKCNNNNTNHGIRIFWLFVALSLVEGIFCVFGRDAEVMIFSRAQFIINFIVPNNSFKESNNLGERLMAPLGMPSLGRKCSRYHHLSWKDCS